MSVSRDFYVIAGYDLTGWDTDKLRDWKWEDGEEYIYVTIPKVIFSCLTTL